MYLMQTREEFVSSPHTRRYFQVTLTREQAGQLFSAHAEVFPCPYRQQSVCWSLLRTRGGISLRDQDCSSEPPLKVGSVGLAA